MIVRRRSILPGRTTEQAAIVGVKREATSLTEPSSTTCIVYSISLVQKPETRLKNTKRVKAPSQKSQGGVTDLEMES